MSQSKTSGRKSVAGMGSIRKKEKVVNGKAYTYYEARYTVGIDLGTGKQIQKSISGKTQREVAKKLKEITTSIDTGTYLPSCKLTVGEWLNTWISEYTADWKPLTVSNYSKQIKKHLIPRLGAAKLEDLDTHTAFPAAPAHSLNDVCFRFREAEFFKCVHAESMEQLI